MTEKKNTNFTPQDKNVVKNLSYLELNILATVVYFDIFDYPLTLMELWQYLFDCKNLQSFFSFDFNEEYQEFDFDSFLQVLENSEFLNQRIVQKNGYVFIKYRQDLIEKRILKDKISSQKYKTATRVVKLLRFCPFLKIILVTSSLSLNNVNEQSDIDLMMVVNKNKLWTVRFYCLLFLKIFNLRPREDDKKDKICLNLFVSEEKMCLEGVVLRKQEKNIDIHFAYWLSQTLVLYQDTDSKEFFEENIWLNSFFPNFKPYKTSKLRLVTNQKTVKNFLELIHFNFIGDFLENFYEKLQKKYMPLNISKRVNKDTNVVLSKSVLKFHVNDRRREFLIKFLNNFKFLLNNKPVEEQEKKQKQLSFTSEPVVKKKFYFDRVIEYLLYGFVFFLPWQTRWIFYNADLNGFWEYGSGAVYAVEILLWIIFIIFAIYKAKQIFYLEKIDQQNIIVKKSSVIVIVFLLLAGVSIFYSINKLTTILFFIHLAEAVGLYFLVKNIKLNKIYFYWSFLGGIFIQAAIGIYQFLMQTSFGSKWLGAAVHNSYELGTYVVQTQTERWLRAYGTQAHPNILAAFIGLGLLFLVYLFVYERVKYSKFVLSFVIVFSFALMTTFSKAASLSFLLCLFILFILLFKKDIFRKKFLIIGIVFFISSTVFSFIFSTPILSRINNDNRLENLSYQQRLDQYDEAKQIFAKAWFGVGVGNYTLAINKYVDANRQVWDYQPIHNVYVLSFVELGVWVVILIFTALYYLFKNFPKKQNIFFISVVFLIIIGLFDHFLWSLFTGQLLFWLMLGFSQQIFD